MAGKRKTTSLEFDPLVWMKDTAGAGDGVRNGGTGSRDAKKDSKEKPVVLNDVLNVADANRLAAELRRALKRKGTVLVDAGAVERADAASLQVLAAFHRTAGAAGVTVRWQGATGVLHDAARLLGLTDMLALKES